jgi:SAM-dependent methyltransferase
MNVNNPSSFVRDKSFCNEKNLTIFLKNRQTFSLEDQQQLKYFIDNYADCWRIWNKVRWDAAMNSDGVRELKEYLGDKFVPYYDSSWELAKEWKDKRPRSDREISDFYKKTPNYVYNLVIWDESGDRYPYVQYISPLLKKYSIESIIDFGCGVGTDSLSFIKRGIKTYSIDFSCPATDFFKWRLSNQSLKGKFLDIEPLEAFPIADMFWAIDVLEHVPDPMKVVKMVDLKNCKVFAHCSRFNDDAGGRHPCHINFESRIISEYLASHGFKNVSTKYDLSLWINLNLVDIIS